MVFRVLVNFTRLDVNSCTDECKVVGFGFGGKLCKKLTNVFQR